MNDIVTFANTGKLLRSLMDVDLFETQLQNLLKSLNLNPQEQDLFMFYMNAQFELLTTVEKIKFQTKLI